MPHADKPFSPACERNRAPILAVLRTHFADRRAVLEIGSGSGQHAVHFAAAMPWLSWQCSDVEANLAGIRAWLDEAGLPNTPPPLALDAAGTWPARTFDAVFTANTLHIMGWDEVGQCFAGIGQVLDAGGVVVAYGPFRRGGHHTSGSNAEFDGWLRARPALGRARVRGRGRVGARDRPGAGGRCRDAGHQRLPGVAAPARRSVKKRRAPHRALRRACGRGPT
jgi:hypothetical protein